MRVILTSAAVALGFLLSLPVWCADPVPSPPKTTAELQSRLAEIMHKADVPGAGIALFDRDGVIWAGGVGYADREEKKPVTADTLFRVGSITKGFVAIALLQLAEQGKLDLNARLSDLAPEIPVTNPWEHSDPVTLAEVLEHSAGLDDMHFPRLYNFNEDPAIPLRTVIERSAPELRVRWRPGSRVAYSNDDYLIAGYVLEKLTGEPYERYVTEHVLLPLAMDHASLNPDPATQSGLAQGYEGGDQHAVKPIPIYLRSAGALMASPAELAHLGVMLLNRGEWHGMLVLTAASVKRMETPETTAASRHGLEYGYGLANYTSYIDGYEFHGHDGGIDGFDSRYIYSPQQGVGYVLLVNSASPGKAFKEAKKLIVSYLMRDKPKPQPPAPMRVSSSDLDSLTGYYREENPRNQVLAVADYLLGIAHAGPDGKGGLQVSGPFIDSDIFMPVGRGLLRKPENPAPDSDFYTREDGRQVLDIEPDAGGAYLVKVGFISAYGPLVLECIVLLLMLSSVLFAPVWIVRKLLGRMQGVRHWNLRLLPLVSALSFAIMIASLMSLAPIQLGTLNVKTASFFVSSLLFALASVLALVQSLRAFRWNVNAWLRWHTLLVAAGCSGLALFLGTWGLIGLRLWDF